jgi:hypothetical protein
VLSSIISPFLCVSLCFSIYYITPISDDVNSFPEVFWKVFRVRVSCLRLQSFGEGFGSSLNKQSRCCVQIRGPDMLCASSTGKPFSGKCMVALNQKNQQLPLTWYGTTMTALIVISSIIFYLSLAYIIRGTCTQIWRPDKVWADIKNGYKI